MHSEAVFGRNLPPKNYHHLVITKYRYDEIDRERENRFRRDQRSFFSKNWRMVRFPKMLNLFELIFAICAQPFRSGARKSKKLTPTAY
jgi:hypothetical protein